MVSGYEPTKVGWGYEPTWFEYWTYSILNCFDVVLIIAIVNSRRELCFALIFIIIVVIAMAIIAFN